MADNCPPVHPHLIDPKASAPLLLQTSPPLWHHLNTPAKKILSSITAHTLAPFSLSLSHHNVCLVFGAPAPHYQSNKHSCGKFRTYRNLTLWYN